MSDEFRRDLNRDNLTHVRVAQEINPKLKNYVSQKEDKYTDFKSKSIFNPSLSKKILKMENSEKRSKSILGIGVVSLLVLLGILGCVIYMTYRIAHPIPGSVVLVNSSSTVLPVTTLSTTAPVVTTTFLPTTSFPVTAATTIPTTITTTYTTPTTTTTITTTTASSTTSPTTISSTTTTTTTSKTATIILKAAK